MRTFYGSQEKSSSLLLTPVMHHKCLVTQSMVSCLDPEVPILSVGVVAVYEGGKHSSGCSPRQLNLHISSH